MKFFDYQDRAKRQTILLVVLFTLAVVTLVTVLNLFLALLYVFFVDSSESLETMRGSHWFTITLVVLLVIGGASLLRWAQLQGGGKAIAESLGGRLVDTSSQDFYLRRLLNVVEEVALASGVPVPPVYVLPEQTINAFAAGYRPADAVIGVTEGTMKKLTRDQLQGVIAHEFSHILNGDMRMNIRIMALLYGIVFVGLVGRGLLEFTSQAIRSSRSKRKDGFAGLVMVALGLIIIGYSGLFFGSLIKAAISRQREYLADASAVQFTRNPQGIGGALKVIATEGSRIPGAASQEASHFFFGDVNKPSFFANFMGLFATHPPIDQRIRRIDPRWKGEYLKAQTQSQARSESAHISQFGGQQLSPSAALGSVQEAERMMDDAYRNSQLAVRQAGRVTELARDAGTAPALIYVLLLKPSSYAQQLEIIHSGPFADLATEHFVQELQQELADFTKEQKLALVELAIPALKQMGSESYQLWIRDVVRLVEVHEQKQVFDWCLTRILRDYLHAHFYPRLQVQDRYSEIELFSAAGILMSALAYFGAERAEDRYPAFKSGCLAAKLKSLQYVEKFNIKAMNEALNKLQNSSLAVKDRCMRAFKAIVAYDKQLNDDELSLLMAISVALGMPLIMEDIRAL